MSMSVLQSDRLRKNITIASFLFLSLLITAPQAISQPCAVSPSAGGVTVLPNVLVIFDNSGSMLEDAHQGSYSRTTTYEGMFDPTGRYSYNSSNGYFYENSSGEWSGNFLNWISMTKVDLARQVLTGGKVYPYEGNNYMVSNVAVRSKGRYGFNDNTSPYQTNFHGSYYYRHDGDIGSEWSGFRVYSRYWDSGSGEYVYTWQATYNIILLLPAGYTPQGLLHSLEGKVRLGLMHFNDNQGGYVEEYIKKLDSTHLATIVTKLNRDLDTDYPSTWTPLAETLYEATRYFSQVDSYTAYGGANYTADPGGTNDPLYSEDHGDVVWCAKNYVVLLTDGNSTQDQEIPTALQDYYDDGLGCTPDPDPCGCDPDYDCSGGGFSDSGSAYLDDIAYYAHTVDLRPSDGGTRALEGDQTITLHNVYLFGVVGEADVLLDKAAQRGGGDYYRAETASAIATALEDIFLVITEKAAAAASTAITSEPVEGIDMIYVPYYKNPEEDQWLGNIKAFRLGVDGYLLAGDTGTTPAVDSDGDLVLDDPKWEASAKIKEKGDTDRTIFTFISGSKVNFDTGNAATLGPYFDVDLDNDATLDEVGTDQEVNALISYIRGDDTPSGFSGLRERDPYLLGDIMHASPVFVGKPSARYDLTYGDLSYWTFYWSNASRTPVLYAPANDGMLHCFDADDGEELWAYIPYNLLPHLKWLADPNYCHCYYVDLTANVWDIKLSTGWKSILVGGMRLGGTPDVVDTDDDGTEDETLKSALFALDVTDPATPVVKWEINDDASARFGYTTSKPVPVRVADGTTSKWFMVFGSGPKTRDGAGGDTSDGYSVTNGSIFAIDVESGNITTIGVGAWSTGNFFGSPVAIDYDLDYKVDLIYIGDAKGNLWRIKTFTVSGGVKSYYTDPANWIVDVDEGTTTDIDPLLSLGTDQPILLKPVVSKDDKGRVWIFFGTGRYFCSDDNEYCGEGNACPASGGCSVADTVGTRSKYMAVGVYDRHWNDTGDPETSGFVLQNSTLGTGNLDHRVIVEGEIVGSGETGYYVVDATTGEIATDVSTNGWYYHLYEDRERCLGDFLIYEGAVFYLTFTPDVSDPCVRGGLSNLYGVYYTSGTSTASPIIDLTGEGNVNGGDLVEGDDDKTRGAAMKKLGKGFAGGGLKIKRFEVTGGGYVVKGYPPLPENPPLTLEPPGESSSTGVTSWREVLQ
jgi:type IV pilus assembly protein PilY1